MCQISAAGAPSATAATPRTFNAMVWQSYARATLIEFPRPKLEMTSFARNWRRFLSAGFSFISYSRFVWTVRVQQYQPYIRLFDRMLMNCWRFICLVLKNWMTENRSKSFRWNFVALTFKIDWDRLFSFVLWALLTQSFARLFIFSMLN